MANKHEKRVSFPIHGDGGNVDTMRDIFHHLVLNSVVRCSVWASRHTRVLLVEVQFHIGF